MKVCGLTDEEIEEKFGHLIHALELGAPPLVASRSASTAWSCCLLTNNPFVTLSFPKTSSSIHDGAPNQVTACQLKEVVFVSCNHRSGGPVACISERN